MNRLSIQAGTGKIFAKLVNSVEWCFLNLTRVVVMVTNVRRHPYTKSSSDDYKGMCLIPMVSILSLVYILFKEVLRYCHIGIRLTLECVH